MTFASTEPRIGVPDLTSVIVASNIGTPGVGGLPSVPTEAQLGEYVEGYDSTLGKGKFIFLRVPVSTVVTAGLLYQYDKNYQVTLVPVGATSKNTAANVVAAINSVASNANAVQYTWFQIQGTATVLKTAVAVPPGSPVYMSATAGRIKVLSSAGMSILGARSNNTATVSAAVSSVPVVLTFSALEGA